MGTKERGRERRGTTASRRIPLLLQTDLPRRQLRAKVQKRGNALYFFDVECHLASSSTRLRRVWGQMFPPSACHSFTRAYSTRCLARAAREKLRKLATTRFFSPRGETVSTFEWRVKSVKDDCLRKVARNVFVSLCSELCHVERTFASIFVA